MGGKITSAKRPYRTVRNIIEGEIETALGQLRDVVNATIGFDTLAVETNIPKTGLMRMLSDNGNPRGGNLTAILEAIGHNVGVQISGHAEPIQEQVAA